MSNEGIQGRDGIQPTPARKVDTYACPECGSSTPGKQGQTSGPYCWLCYAPLRASTTSADGSQPPSDPGTSGGNGSFLVTFVGIPFFFVVFATLIAISPGLAVVAGFFALLIGIACSRPAVTPEVTAGSFDPANNTNQAPLSTGAFLLRAFLCLAIFLFAVFVAVGIYCAFFFRLGPMI